MKNRKFRMIVTCLFALVQIFSSYGFSYAAGTGLVVINEIAWAGSADSANDEWIELYNPTSQNVDLAGWTINDDQGASIYLLSGSITANGYYLIEDSESAVQPMVADVVINLSLANTGDSLVLVDATGTVVDAVNSSGGMWPWGNFTTNASMERINASVSGDDAANWVTSDGTGSVATASAGTQILGTPKMKNSKAATGTIDAEVSMSLSEEMPKIGDEIVLSVDINDVNDLFSYGFRIDYDPAVLAYKASNSGDFLSAQGVVATSFQSGLQDGNEGVLIVAEARTQDIKTGVSGGGNLFTVAFDVIGGEGEESVVSFGSNTFVSGLNGDLNSTFADAKFTPQNPIAEAVTNLSAAEDLQRYAIKLSWQAPLNGAEKYRVYRMNSRGIWVKLGETSLLEFVDSDSIAGGGRIIPKVLYKYKVTAINGTLESAAVDVSGTDMRGLIGDNTRSDLVDGRDLDLLARNFALTEGDSGFNALTDTTYDGVTDGSDLIDLGASFASVYK